MKQAHRWLPVIAALVLVPSVASAQKKRAGKKPTTTTTAPAPAATTAPGGASTEIDLDADPNAKPVELDAPATTTATTTTTTETTGATGSICDIDPSACPKELDVNAAAKKSVAAEIYAVQQIYALRSHRFEIQPYWGFTLNDQFVSHTAPGIALNYYITNVLAVGVNGNWYGSLNSDSEFNFQNRRAARIAVPLNEYQWNANANFTYVPMYGKFAGFGEFIFHYDAYVVGGIGAISTRPIPVIDPDNRTFDYKPKLDFTAGIGLRIFFNRWFAFNFEVRDYIYNEKLESLTIASTPAGQQDKSTWTRDTRITNNVQAQVGVSVFLPFSWDYRLPK